MRQLLLISNSTNHGGGYLEHCADAMREFVGKRRLLFIPFALADRDGYAAHAIRRFQELGIEATSLHRSRDPRAEIEKAEAIFTGGGNSWRLLRTLRDLEIIRPLRERVLRGELRYSGASAGTNMACPTIRTTNDMPIVDPGGMGALGLIDFQVNPHYLDPQPDLPHMGETREQRLTEFHEENSPPVVGLREGAWLRVEGDSIRLEGSAAARLFRAGAAAEELTPGQSLPADFR